MLTFYHSYHNSEWLTQHFSIKCNKIFYSPLWTMLLPYWCTVPVVLFTALLIIQYMSQDSWRELKWLGISHNATVAHSGCTRITKWIKMGCLQKEKCALWDKIKMPINDSPDTVLKISESHRHAVVPVQINSILYLKTNYKHYKALYTSSD